MKKILVILLLVEICWISAEKLKKKNFRLKSESDDPDDWIHPYPPDVIESVHSDIPGDPQIKVRFAGTDEDDDGVVSVETDSDEDDLPMKKKSQSDDIHSFL